MICGLLIGNEFPSFVGVARLELTTSWSQTRHTTKLYYTPKLFLLKEIIHDHSFPRIPF